jgi:hypothetical protein
MAVYKNCLMDTYHGDGSNNNQPCQVRIDERTLALSYQDADGPVVYQGQERGEGHYELANASGGRGTLHCFKGSVFLEGYWIEKGAEGMWRIRLED